MVRNLIISQTHLYWRLPSKTTENFVKNGLEYVISIMLIIRNFQSGYFSKQYNSLRFRGIGVGQRCAAGSGWGGRANAASSVQSETRTGSWGRHV